MTIGVRLKEERSRLGLNQTDMAAAGGVGKTTQINYEKGAGAPDAFYLAAVERLGVDVLYVVTGQRRPAPADSIESDELELLTQYRQLPQDQRAHTRTMVTALAEMAGRYEVNGNK
ncbi:helix-turn-helix transcriptional regulator [Pseudomonas sp. PDM12]|uniref:helix-turn-helix domain-containing protein n=1 Tax=Pseudomonas sp. PDM12 TaxID=2769260 RepID=UPI00178727C3|nr:helix-turn-helix transcriptional regulator [Pseudomonas sp. PDM12]MBD9653557.1 helix-turn-helix transcriptional regulator [Pseudomonas sp. PDM12]